LHAVYRAERELPQSGVEKHRSDKKTKYVAVNLDIPIRKRASARARGMIRN
jgi:hypothetical protein